MRRGPGLILVLFALAACADDGAPERTGSAIIVTTTTAATTAATTSETSSVAPPDTSAQPPRVGNPTVTSVVVAEFDHPIDLAVRPADSALYIVEQTGRVVRFEDDERVVVADVTGRTAPGGERGLLGLAFSADGSYAYLDYTDLDGDTVVAEYPVADDGTLDVDAERILITVDQPYSNHNAGDLDVGPDGMLYITLGDGGSANDPGRNGSDPSTLLGSLLRIDPRPSAGMPYTIPTDNPFAEGSFGGVAGAPEVWAWGLRNPWKIAFDPVTGDLWIADVGQNKIEEVNLVSPEDGVTAGRGVSFGWSAFEGTERFNADVPEDGAWMPVLSYLHGDDGCSISGGVPYRGTAIPELAPAYVYSDYCSGIVWALDLAGGRNLTLLGGFQSVSAVRSGPDGELYVLELSGKLHRLVPG
jgi:glucose/arabinose dehydrogenase